MKTKNIIAAFLFCMAGSSMALAQGSKDDPAAIEKAWNDFMTPGSMHRMMAASDGEWNEEITLWMAPGAPPTMSIATCTNSMIMGGRYQQSVHKGTFNNMPFEGLSIWGYNNASKSFESTWIDNMGTGIMFMEGTWDDKSRTAVFKGKSTDPVTGKISTMREVFKIVDDNTQTMEMFESKEGKENKTMVIKFTRKK
jgi:hypothetical protein